MNMALWFSGIVEIAAKRKRFTAKDDEISNMIYKVLEAAGKVDRAKALEGMEAMRAMMSRELFMDGGPTFQAVHELLQALPDEEGEKR